MKPTVATIFASLIVVTLAFAPGCGSGRRATPQDGGIGGFDSGRPLVDSGPLVIDSGPRDTGVDAFLAPVDAGRDAGGRVCATSCTRDSDCASTCPLVPSRAACCDLGTNTCYTATTSICAASGEDGGTTMSY